MNTQTALSDKGTKNRMTGAPRSLSNLQKLEFKANRDDDHISDEDSDFSDDEKHLISPISLSNTKTHLANRTQEIDPNNL